MTTVLKHPNTRTCWIAFFDAIDPASRMVSGFRGLALVDVPLPKNEYAYNSIVEDDELREIIIQKTIDQKCNAGKIAMVTVLRPYHKVDDMWKNRLLDEDEMNHVREMLHGRGRMQ